MGALLILILVRFIKVKGDNYTAIPTIQDIIFYLRIKKTL